MLASYSEVLHYLYSHLPMFQRVGAVAYKKDLTNTLRLCEALGNPQHKFKSIHIAGTNGKGSTSHLLASVLQEAGYKTGLYTSPHLKEFTERIRVNGQEVSRQFVVDFVNKTQQAIEEIKPSFFEVTVAMAFDYFARQSVDVAVVEVGLGGRLDSTNVITPLISVITNIGWDHMDLLGDTLPKIAFEKAGIIKPHVPVVVSERQEEVQHVFIERAQQQSAALFFASDQYEATLHGHHLTIKKNKALLLEVDHFPLTGQYQQQNLPGVMQAIDFLQAQLPVSLHHLRAGLQKVVVNTSLKGRWQQLGTSPTVFCDTGHNEAGVRQVLQMIEKQSFDRLRIVWGMVRDKDHSKVLSLLPKDAIYYFCQARIPRAMPALELQQLAARFSLRGVVVEDVNDALARARNEAGARDFIFVGGSTFVVAELNEM
ncbi:MAG: bifunctional folylpolyglutamate synthase/dihydrofolate synthase [Bacteroidota bacterium]